MNVSKTAAFVAAPAVTLGILAAAKITGKPVGMKGSIAHAMTNPNLDKAGYLKDEFKSDVKTSAALLGTAGVAGGLAALKTKLKPETAGKAVQEMVSGAGELLKKVKVGDGNLKEIVKETKAFEVFKKLPKPAQAAVLIGGGALALLAPFAAIARTSQAGYNEAKNEQA